MKKIIKTIGTIKSHITNKQGNTLPNMKSLNKDRDEIYEKPISNYNLNLDTDRMLKVYLEGIYDPDCPFSMLRGCPHLLKKIWKLIVDHWKEIIQFPSPLAREDFEWKCFRGCVDDYTKKEVHPDAFFLVPIFPENSFFGSKEEPLRFPTPSNININMMPFILEKSFEGYQLPVYLEPYWNMIKACIRPEFAKESHPMWHGRHAPEVGKVCYLTIQESLVDKGTSQRRPGLHVDHPGTVRIKNEIIHPAKKGEGQSTPYTGHNWGSGGAHIINTEGAWDRMNFVVMTGGIYMATSVPDSSMAWDCKIVPDSGGREEIGELGNIEHLRDVLPPGQMLAAHQMYWMTDRTPHQSLPLPEGGQRQFFRLVTSEVSLWYRDHSTPNPLGVVPDKSITKIVKGNKFSPEGVEME